ncbi:reverse transcriptase domain, Reverse transcriptase zinc-binding domain protein [Artemisia annua]|uniref:Reverse transcriptase domain, Reverse transcriptase zinc-binding domain protein n=1 Tax=Artemisia annua TaxID=35608 RepID=A0A2U1MIN1_ARTAN|nr:reverse transcriptase domain, Reverse transcriptase zinc-binding domain protein [Artemisia annua]
MSEQEPKPPNPNEFTSPPPVVNPPSSRLDKNLKTKKTNRSLNTKNNSTMKHVAMLSKSSDVNFKKGMLRSSGNGSEEMDIGDEGREQMDVQKEVVDEGMSSGVQGEFGQLKEGIGKAISTENTGSNSNGDENVSDMFPELNNVYGSKKSNVVSNDSNVLPNTHVLVNDNVVLSYDAIDKNGKEGSKMMEGNNSGNDSGSNGNVGNGTKMQVDSGNVGVQSGNNNDGMKVNGNASKPMSFSSAVQGRNFGGSNKLKLIPCSKNNEGTPIIMDKVTASMCEKAYGRASFARVLIEVDASKGIVDSVEVWYKQLGRSMALKVEYAWLPPVCNHCGVFGHSFKGCNNKVLTEEEKSERAGLNGQKNIKNDGDNRANDGWQTAYNRRSYGSTTMPDKAQPSPTKPNDGAGTSQNNVHPTSNNYMGTNSHTGVNGGRGGVYFGRGGYNVRGRGGMNGRGGMYGRGNYGGSNLNNEKKYVHINASEKGKNVVSEELTNLKKDSDKVKGKETQVKHIAQKNFTTKNRFAALADDGKEDEQNELIGIKINIDVACEMGIDISNEERSKWPKELQEYYAQKCSIMGKQEKVVKLKEKIVELESNISSRCKSIEAKATEEANDRVTEEMEATDSHTHLFFSCHFARRLWERLKPMAKLDNVSNCWPQIISSIVNRPAKNSIWSVIQRLVWGASVYFIWQERNVRLFGNNSRTENELFKIIIDTVRFRLMGLKINVTSDVIAAAEVWNLPISKYHKYKVMLDDLMADNMNIDAFYADLYQHKWNVSKGKGLNWMMLGRLCTTGDDRIYDALFCSKLGVVEVPFTIGMQLHLYSIINLRWLILKEYWFSSSLDKELCTTAEYRDSDCADYVHMGDYLDHLYHKELCTTAKYLDLVCADYVKRWNMVCQVFSELYCRADGFCYMIWFLVDVPGQSWCFQVYYCLNQSLMELYNLINHSYLKVIPYTLFPCSRFFPQGFVGQGFFNEIWVVGDYLSVLKKNNRDTDQEKGEEQIEE